MALSEDVLTKHGQAVLLSQGWEPRVGERPDLSAWRRRDAVRRSNAAQPIPSKRRYRRGAKHKDRAQD